MIEVKKLYEGLGVRIKLQHADLLLVTAKAGYIMCGYLDLETAEKLGDAACIVRGVATFEDVLAAEIKEVSSAAKKLGVKEGMTGRDALDLFST